MNIHNGLKRRNCFAVILLLVVISCITATSCRAPEKKIPPAVPAAVEPGEQNGFVRAWGTDLSSGGNLSGPGALLRLPGGSLLVLDRFNNRIQSYSIDGKYLGAWGRTPDGKPFPFTLLVDITRDDTSGEVVAGVVHNISGAELKKLRGGLFRADTFLRFSPKGEFKGDASLIEDLENSPARAPEFLKVIDSLFWNRNELLPMSVFGRIAADSGVAKNTVWQALLGEPEIIDTRTGAVRAMKVDAPGAKSAEFCEIEIVAGGRMLLTGCLHNTDVVDAKISTAGSPASEAKVFIHSPAPPDMSPDTLMMNDVFRKKPSGGYAMLVAREKKIYTFDAAGKKASVVKINATLNYAVDLEFDGRGGYFVADYLEDCVLHVSSAGKLLGRIGTDRGAPGQFAGRSFQAFVSGAIKPRAPRPPGVVGVAVSPDGTVFASDAGNKRVMVYSADGKYLKSFHPCPAAGRCMPADLQYGNNALYVSLFGAGMAVKLDARAGKILAKWRPSPGNPNAPCSVCGLCLGPDGSVYATDGISVFKLDPNLRQDPAWNRSALSIPTLTNPNDIAVDKNGNYYVVGTVQPGIFARSSAACKFTSNAEADKCFTLKNLYHPRSVATGAGGVYISNSGKDTVIRLSYDGAPYDLWGGEGRADGMFQNPLGITVTADGSLFIADNGNERIQQFRTGQVR